MERVRPCQNKPATTCQPQSSLSQLLDGTTDVGLSTMLLVVVPYVVVEGRLAGNGIGCRLLRQNVAGCARHNASSDHHVCDHHVCGGFQFETSRHANLHLGCDTPLGYPLGCDTPSLLAPRNNRHVVGGRCALCGRVLYLLIEPCWSVRSNLNKPSLFLRELTFAKKNNIAFAAALFTLSRF